MTDPVIDQAEEKKKKGRKRLAIILIASTLVAGGSAAGVAAWLSQKDITATVASTDPGFAIGTSAANVNDSNLDISDKIGQLKPGASFSVPVYAANTTSGSANADVEISEADIVSSGAIFSGTAPATVKWSASPVGKVLPKSGEAVQIGAVQVSAPTTWPDSYRGSTGGIDIQLTVTE